MLSGIPTNRFISNFVLSVYVLCEFTVQDLTGNINKLISILQVNYKLCPDDAKNKGLYAVLCIHFLPPKSKLYKERENNVKY